MKFVDSASIRIEAGKGGAGCLGFRRERYISDGGPDGGDGGDGGHVYFQGQDGLNTLSEFCFKRLFRAKNGQPGSGQNKRGKSAQHLTVGIPLGTKVYDLATDELIGEMTKHEQTILVAKGGFHGLGNTRFKSSINRAPRETTPGFPGEVREIGLELSVMADIGLLGIPNAGKSSLIRQISSARPKVADYPFTTLHPSLSVVSCYDKHIVIADIPGLIENASKGAGLGFKFLKHLSRVKVLLHVVDILPVDGSDPVKNFLIIEKELKRYDQELSNKEKLLVINKIDLLPEKDRNTIVQSLLKDIYYKGKFYSISALNGFGCKDLVAGLFKLVIIK
ncbi:Obg family GTPase CgtA [Candidatus Vesicomyidisocius sp. SY067_SCS001]|uniref:Obg family GTPase CgtA n=1 Tax=Candidatus Vesicomyidisocius sp. SY067_SCS001 TaxID=2732590 RepID=UPI001689CF6A|nr:Obg family GTPase CgtA [Candidatus Vesicomyosocius sp. SY067_SCS001]